MEDEKLGLVQQTFVEEDTFRRGYCTPGQVIAAEGLLRRSPYFHIEGIREGMHGNLRRCAAYAPIFKAVWKASELRKRAL